MQNLSAKYGKTLNLDKLTSYCPGCGHGIVTRLVAEAIETLGIRERAIAIVGIGCGGFSHHYMDVDAIEATHGRSPSFAVGYKLCRPDNIVFTYCGDGDSCAIGLVVDERLNRVVVVSCIDNLVKGAAGQAVQNMNLLFGLPETEGLSALPWSL